jgi:uncharacterized tellurite resistance protein B-like protein
MTPEDKFRFLLQMAAADQSITTEEMRLLGDRAITWGITDDQFECMIEEAIRGEASLTFPTDREERTEVLADLVRMMGADGHLDEREKRLFAVVAARADMNAERINEIIDAAIKGDPDCA